MRRRESVETCIQFAPEKTLTQGRGSVLRCVYSFSCPLPMVDNPKFPVSRCEGSPLLEPPRMNPMWVPHLSPLQQLHFRILQSLQQDLARLMEVTQLANPKEKDVGPAN
jgi:hypothetical protein